MAVIYKITCLALNDIGSLLFMKSESYLLVKYLLLVYVSTVLTTEEPCTKLFANIVPIKTSENSRKRVNMESFLVNYRLAASYLTEKHLPLICSWVCLWAFLSSCFSKQLCIAIFVIQLHFHEQCSGNWSQNINFCWWYYLWLRIYIIIYEKNKCFILLPLCLSLNTLL